MAKKHVLIVALVSLGLATAGVLLTTHLPAASDPEPTTPMGPGRIGPGRMGPGQMGPGHMMQGMHVSSEFEFLSHMIPHHQEAIDTARRVLQSSDRPEMRQFAQRIIAVQSSEIQQMQRWLKQWYPGQTSQAAYQPMMRDLSQLKGNDLDRAFLQDMIWHHMGAVMMSQMLINHGLVQHAPVRPFALNIANAQRQEIGQMRTWLSNWYGISGMPCGMSGSTSGMMP